EPRVDRNLRAELLDDLDVVALERGRRRQDLVGGILGAHARRARGYSSLVRVREHGLSQNGEDEESVTGHGQGFFGCAGAAGCAPAAAGSGVAGAAASPAGAAASPAGAAASPAGASPPACAGFGRPNTGSIEAFSLGGSAGIRCDGVFFASSTISFIACSIGIRKVGCMPSTGAFLPASEMLRISSALRPFAVMSWPP